MDTAVCHALLQFPLYKACYGVVCDFSDLHIAQNGENMVVQNLFVVRICALLYGIADMCFPLYTYCTDPVIPGWGGGPAGVHRQIRSFRYDLGFLVFYFLSLIHI